MGELKMGIPMLKRTSINPCGIEIPASKIVFVRKRIIIIIKKIMLSGRCCILSVYIFARIKFCEFRQFCLKLRISVLAKSLENFFKKSKKRRIFEVF